DMRAAHSQLCAVNSDLGPCLPAFPPEDPPPGGSVWTVIFGPPEASRRETDALCFQVQVYLGHARDTCGWKVVSQVLFSEGHDAEEYYEDLGELRQKGYEDALQRADARLQQACNLTLSDSVELLDRHRGLDSMVDLLQVYPEEDQAYEELLEATTQLYHYPHFQPHLPPYALLSPPHFQPHLPPYDTGLRGQHTCFLPALVVRETWFWVSLETERLGPRRVEGLTREREEWQRKAHAAVLSIQDLTAKYFHTTTRAQKAMLERMRADQRKLGKSSWSTAAGRMESLQYTVSKETLQLMRAKEVCLEQRKHGLREEMQSLQAGEDALLRLDQLEVLYYQLQLQLYGVQAEVLRCEELLLTAQLASLRRQMTERQDEVVYYDAYESPDAIPLTDEELVVLQHKTRQLEARRGRITSKRAHLKNKKDICIVNHNQKMHQRQGSQSDGDSLKTLHQERRKTLLGLRSHSQRFPGQVTLKSSRLRLGLPHAKRRPGGPASPGTPPGTQGEGGGPPDGGLPGDGCESLGPLPLASLPLAPFSPRFFDSSQLLNARKKLKKTASLDSAPWRRAGSPMDEVLASLKRGCFRLRKAELRVLRDPDEDEDDNILAQIRQGVLLRKVRARPPAADRRRPGLTHAADALTRSIHEALRRIKEASPDSESEDEGLPCADWEN
ncbi:hypothetical protein NHX12_027685, partial [Muraenolepis orangiensis]